MDVFIWTQKCRMIIVIFECKKCEKAELFTNLITDKS